MTVLDEYLGFFEKLDKRVRNERVTQLVPKLDFAKRADSADALIPQMREVFLTQTSETWLTRLHASDIITERILTPGDWLHNAHVEATKAAVCQDTSGVGLVYSPRTPGFPGFSEDNLRPAPGIGADSREVLRDAGFDGKAIDDLIKAGVVRTSTR